MLVYVSLLPNQKPAATTVLVDDFELMEHAVTVHLDSRPCGADASFDRQQPGPESAPWHFENMGGDRIQRNIVENAGRRFFTMAMGKDTSNYESAQLWPSLDLREGARYQLSCRMRWDNFLPGAPAPIVNYGIYHEDSRTWYGSVDQTLKKTADWRTYRFTHIPPFSGRWKLYVQLNGWGNFGRGVTVSVDGFGCAAVN